MKGLGHYLIPLLDGLAEMKHQPLNIVEVGTMFKTELEPGETDLRARSTYAIAEWIESSGQAHNFISIDADFGHIETCRAALGDRARLVSFMLGKGVDCLARLPLPYLDFLLLDADSDAHSTYAEFGIAGKLRAVRSIVVIDDAFKHPSVNKANEILPQVNYYTLGGIAVTIPSGREAVQLCAEAQKL